MSYVRCVCGEVYNTVGTTTGMSGCCPKCGLHYSGQYRVAKPVLKPSPLVAKPIDPTEIIIKHTPVEYYVNHVMDKITKRDVDQVSEKLRALGWEEVVHCRDCRHLDTPDWDNNLAACYGEPPLFCMQLSYNEWRMDGDRRVADPTFLEVEPDDFCAWGERKSE